jgi:hypothetical protein
MLLLILHAATCAAGLPPSSIQVSFNGTTYELPESAPAAGAVPVADWRPTYKIMGKGFGQKETVLFKEVLAATGFRESDTPFHTEDLLWHNG